jgi:hypothetical protein
MTFLPSFGQRLALPITGLTSAGVKAIRAAYRAAALLFKLRKNWDK